MHLKLGLSYVPCYLNFLFLKKGVMINMAIIKGKTNSCLMKFSSVDPGSACVRSGVCSPVSVGSAEMM